MNTNLTDAAGLPLSQEQMNQQIDLALRLMHMAVNGGPTPDSASGLTTNQLALHALMTAFGSLAAADAALTEKAAAAMEDLAKALQSHRALKYLTNRSTSSVLPATH